MITIICDEIQRQTIIEALQDCQCCLFGSTLCSTQFNGCMACIDDNINWIHPEKLTKPAVISVHSCADCEHAKKKITEEPCFSCVHGGGFENNARTDKWSPQL